MYRETLGVSEYALQSKKREVQRSSRIELSPGELALDPSGMGLVWLIVVFFAQAVERRKRANFGLFINPRRPQQSAKMSRGKQNQLDSCERYGGIVAIW